MAQGKRQPASPMRPSARARAVLWRRLDEPGAEFCSLTPTVDGWRLAGTVCLAHQGFPYLIRYSVDCGPTWETRAAEVRVFDGRWVRQSAVTVESPDKWRHDGKLVEALDGVLDIDLGFTPSTNTLPIRRLQLPVGGSAELQAAWMKFPDLSLRSLEQRYTRMSGSRYLYESGGGSFQVEMQVDEAGLVSKYPGYWIREAAW